MLLPCINIYWGFKQTECDVLYIFQSKDDPLKKPNTP